MFADTYQAKYLSILYSIGSKPLQAWKSHVQNGRLQRVRDELICSSTVELTGNNVSTCYIECPQDARAELGIKLPFLVLIIKNLNKIFSFEVEIMDDTRTKRRFRAGTYQSEMRKCHFMCAMALSLDEGWNQIQFNLADFTTRAYGTKFSHVTRIKINANCRIRRVYFSRRLYDDTELPADFRLYLPVQTTGRSSTAALPGGSNAELPAQPTPSSRPPTVIPTIPGQYSPTTEDRKISSKSSRTVSRVNSTTNKIKKIPSTSSRPSISRTSSQASRISTAGTSRQQPGNVAENDPNVTISPEEIEKRKIMESVSGLKNKIDEIAAQRVNTPPQSVPSDFLHNMSPTYTAPTPTQMDVPMNSIVMANNSAQELPNNSNILKPEIFVNSVISSQLSSIPQTKTPDSTNTSNINHTKEFQFVKDNDFPSYGINSTSFTTNAISLFHNTITTPTTSTTEVTDTTEIETTIETTEIETQTSSFENIPNIDVSTPAKIKICQSFEIKDKTDSDNTSIIDMNNNNIPNSSNSVEFSVTDSPESYPTEETRRQREQIRLNTIQTNIQNYTQQEFKNEDNSIYNEIDPNYNEIDPNFNEIDLNFNEENYNFNEGNSNINEDDFNFIKIDSNNNEENFNINEENSNFNEDDSHFNEIDHNFNEERNFNETNGNYDEDGLENDNGDENNNNKDDKNTFDESYKKEVECTEEIRDETPSMMDNISCEYPQELDNFVREEQVEIKGNTYELLNEDGLFLPNNDSNTNSPEYSID